jgi:hypothetical protein
MKFCVDYDFGPYMALKPQSFIFTMARWLSPLYYVRKTSAATGGFVPIPVHTEWFRAKWFRPDFKAGNTRSNNCVMGSGFVPLSGFAPMY